MGNIFWKCLGLVGDLDPHGGGYEPSPFAKMMAVDKKTDYKPVEFKTKYKGSKKVLVICTEIRYMTMENGTKFSTGNHPVELGQPLMHLTNAGFDFDIATSTGDPAALEEWALPLKDVTFMQFFRENVKPKADKPLSLSSIVASDNVLEEYVCFFTPGGQGAMLGLPEDPSLAKVIDFAKANDILFMSVCHGPASFLAAKQTPHPYAGYRVACFPDSIDKQSHKIGYMPGKQTWFYGEKLVEKGITITNTDPDDSFEHDRLLLTGASPKACQSLGTVAAEHLLETYDDEEVVF